MAHRSRRMGDRMAIRTLIASIAQCSWQVARNPRVDAA
jgi:hypothetical protein